MQNWKKFLRLFLFTLLTISLCAGIVAPRMEAAKAAPKEAAFMDVVISEVAWGGTAANSADEWIELYNATSSDINFAPPPPDSAWTLVSSDATPSITLTGTIPAYGYYLIECTDQNTVSNVTANQIISGACSSNLGNTSGEVLTLKEGASVIDTANSGCGSSCWYSGSGSSTYFSMERISPVVGDSAAAWASNDGITRNGLDANGNPINGTPGTSKVDLSLTMAVNNPAPAVLPGDVIFTVTVTNNGAYTATNIKVNDLLPAGLTFKPPYTTSLAGSTYDDVLGVWTIPALISGASATLGVTATVAAIGVYKNQAEIASFDQLDPNSTPGNGITTEDDYDYKKVYPVGTPLLDIKNIVNNSSPNVGSNVVFTITVNNLSASDATGVQVNAPMLPADFIYISHSSTAGTTYVNGTGVWTIGNLISGSPAAVLTITAQVKSSGTKNYSATVSSNQFANNIAIAVVTPLVATQANLSLTQTWNRSTSVAGIAQLVITVHGDPTNAATNVQVRDLLPSGLTYVSHSFSSSTGMSYSSSAGIWVVGTVPAAGSSILTINVKPAVDGVGTNNFAEIWWSDQFDPNSTPGNGDTGEDDDTNPTAFPPGSEVLVADLTLIQTVNIASGVAVFTITVKNNGPDTASGVIVKNSTLADPTKYTYGSKGVTAGTYFEVVPAPQVVPPAVAGEWRIPTLPDGATATLVVTATLGTSSTVFEKNTAEVVAVTEVDPDSLPNNCLISPFACAEDDNFAAPAPLADLQVTQEVDDDNPDPQDVYGTKNNLVTFTIRVTNNGTYPANLVKIWDVLPSGLVYVSPVSFFSCSVPTVSVPTGMSYNNSGIWTVGTLPSGACLGINITAKSTVNGKFINTAKVWSVTERDPNPYNNFADVAIITHRAVIINEVAWAGTQASAGDQWIELYNPSVDMTITNWKLQINVGCSPASVTDSNVPGIVLSSASGKIVKSGYYLMERGHNATTTEIEDQVYPAIAQNLLPTPNLSTTKITLFLCDNLGNFIDTANYEGFNSGTNPWPQGGNNPPSVVYSPSMERQDTAPERDKSWITNVGYIKNGSDANNDLIYGTPKRSNSYPATPTKIPPTRTPAPPLDRPIINEFLARPGYDWNQDGRVDVFDEFIEIKNIGITTVSLSGWQIDDEEDAGSAAFPLPAITLKPGDRVVYYGLQTNILLSDGGDTVRLINPKGKIFDSYTYAIAKFEDKSTCRLPDGNGSWYEDCIPTPALTNTREGSIPAMGDETYQSPVCSLPDTLPVDFLFAECRGYGANIWRMFWDSGWLIIPDDGSKWISFVE